MSTVVGRYATSAAAMGTEIGVMTVAPSMLEGKLPEPEDFMNAAILMVGMHAANSTAAKLRTIYAKTGIEPGQVLADSKTDPSIVRELTEQTENASDRGSEIPRIYKEVANFRAAADAFPGEKAQQVLAQPFGEIPETKLPYQLNMRYIEGPEDLRALQSRMAAVYESDIDTARGGTRSWAETEDIAARQVADLTGTEIQKVMAGRQIGDTANDVQLKVMGDMLMQSTVEAGEAIKRVKDAGNGASDAMRLEALEAIHRSAMIQADFTGASAELGRALGYLKRVKEIRTQGEGIQKLVEMYGHDPEKMLELASTLDSPEKLAKFAREATKATTEQKLLEIWKAALVSGPFTQVANVMGNTTYMALRPLVDAAAAVGGLATGQADRVHFTEPLARINGDLMGVMDGLKYARAALSIDSPGGKAGSRAAIPGMTGHVIRTPFRLLEGMDQLFRTMNERGEAYAIGAEQAIREGFNPATREFRERMAQIANNPTEAQIERIQKFGERAVFQTPLGEKGKAIGEAIVKNHLEWVVPFRGTPTNILKELIRLTPAGPLLGEWRAALAKGGPEAAKALAEVAVGTGISALTMSMALAGHISGNGDPDPNKRRVQMAAGWQPYSIKFNGTWHSYQRFQPVGTLLGMAADIAEVWQHLTPEESDKVPKMLGIAFANAITNQTFLQGIATFTEAIAQPERKMARFFQNFAGSVIPAAVGQTAQMVDPFQREIASIRDAVQNRIPGLREQLPPQRDPFGEPVPSPERMGWISPVLLKDQSTDKVRTEAARLGIGEGKAPKTIQMPTGGIGGKLGQVELTPEQRDVFGDVAGHTAYQVMQQMVESPGWDYMPDIVKEKAFKMAFERSNQAGKFAALSDEQRQKEIQRIVGEVSKKLKR